VNAIKQKTKIKIENCMFRIPHIICYDINYKNVSFNRYVTFYIQYYDYDDDYDHEC